MQSKGESDALREFWSKCSHSLCRYSYWNDFCFSIHLIVAVIWTAAVKAASTTVLHIRVFIAV